MQHALVLQQPAASARRLLLLFHGVGAGPEDLQPVGAALADRYRDAWVVSVRAPEPSDFGAGWQWFSVRGIDEASRAARVAAAMPRFLETIRHWQGAAQLQATDTTLVGFSQGAIMSLESTQQPEPLARRVIAIAGRLAQPARIAPRLASVHLMHGEQDAVIPCAASVQAAAQLRALGAEPTLDLFAQLGHGIDRRVLDRLLERMDEGVTGR
jgi:phospholipase/carboxylesterase